MHKVFIDGETGTTGLQVQQRLKYHSGIEVISIDHDKRKDDKVKRELMREADVTILCLPDQAAIKSAAIAESVGARVIDASTAHRTAENWVFGLAELNQQQRHLIANASKVSNPGCYPTGAILLLKPLVEAGIQLPFSIHATTGYSGGGNAMIDNYESNAISAEQKAYALYGLDFNHKHIAEIEKYAGLNYRPTFFPAVVNSAQGMMIQIAIHESTIAGNVLSKFIGNETNFGDALHNCYQNCYAHEVNINVHALNAKDSDNSAFLHINNNNDTANLDIYSYYHPEHKQAMLVATFDNLGKGASGAAVQNLNIMLGLDESLGLSLNKAN